MTIEAKDGNPRRAESASEKEKFRTSLFWRSAFESEQEMAELENDRVTAMLQTFTLKVGAYGTFHFRVNSAIATPEGKLETMVVDIGYRKEEDSDTVTPCQQVVIKGVWEETKVIETTSDLSPVNPTEWNLDELLIAKTVAQSLELMK